MNRRKTIIGGGIAGLSCGIVLRLMGYEVEIADKRNSSNPMFVPRGTEDVHVTLIDPEAAKTLESALGIKLVKLNRLNGITNSSNYSIDTTRFFLASKGQSENCINVQLYNRARDLGIIFKNAEEIPEGILNNGTIKATGSATNNQRYRIYCWRFNTDSNLEDRTAIIDFNSFTDSYFYSARLGKTVSSVLLSRIHLDLGDVETHYEQHLRHLIRASPNPQIDNFAVNMPVSIRTYNRRNIGSSRGINDDFFYFGLTDSIVDGINYALSQSGEFNGGEYLRLKNRNNRTLSWITLFKNMTHRIGLKERYINIYLCKPPRSQRIIDLATTPVPEKLLDYLHSLNGSQKTS